MKIDLEGKITNITFDRVSKYVLNIYVERWVRKDGGKPGALKKKSKLEACIQVWHDGSTRLLSGDLEKPTITKHRNEEEAIEYLDKEVLHCA